MSDVEDFIAEWEPFHEDERDVGFRAVCYGCGAVHTSTSEEPHRPTCRFVRDVRGLAAGRGSRARYRRAVEARAEAWDEEAHYAAVAHDHGCGDRFLADAARYKRAARRARRILEALT